MDDESTWVLLSAYPNDLVLVETDVTIRIASCDWIGIGFNRGPFLRGVGEKVKRIAFL